MSQQVEWSDLMWTDTIIATPPLGLSYKLFIPERDKAVLIIRAHTQPRRRYEHSEVDGEDCIWPEGGLDSPDIDLH